MPLEILADLVLFIVELLRISLFIAVPGFVAALACLLARKKLKQRFQSLDWIKSTFLSTYLIITLLIIFMYALPIYQAYANPETGAQPLEKMIEYTAVEQILAKALVLAKLLIASLVITILLQPLVLLASFVQSTVAQKWPLPRHACLFAGVFAASLLVAVLDLFVFPSIGLELISGLFYLIYFW